MDSGIRFMKFLSKSKETKSHASVMFAGNLEALTFTILKLDNLTALSIKSMGKKMFALFETSKLSISEVCW